MTTKLAEPPADRPQPARRAGTRRRPAAHPTTTPARLVWRARGVIAWIIQNITPKEWWNRTTVPGRLVIATNSLLAEKAVASFLGHRKRRRLVWVVTQLFAVLDQEGLVYRHGKESGRRRPLVTAAWRVHVHRGMERAVLHDLFHFVARAMEHEGGYEGIDPHLSMAIARRTLAAHQARRVILTSPDAETLRSGKVRFQDDIHKGYIRMIANGRTGKRPVTVAMLDTKVEPTHLATGVNVVPKLGDVSGDQANRPPLAHGAVTASIIGSLAPTANILVYPIATGQVAARPDESDVIWSVQSAVMAGVEVIVMCLQLPTESKHATRKSLETILDGIGDGPFVIAAAGNRGRTSETAFGRYPGIHREVVMVSAVDSHLRRPAYSCFELPGPSKPALHLVAPGGGDRVRGASREYSVSVGRFEFVGTSVATAYAAGVVARSIASGPKTGRTAKELRQALEDAAMPVEDWDNEVQRCKGLIRQLN
jgi:hypothetical protein